MQARPVLVIATVSLLAGIWLAGCDTDGDRPQAEAEADADADADESDASDGDESTGDGEDASSGGETVVVSGMITAFVEMTPLAGVEVCLHGVPDVACVTTGGDGRYVLEGAPVGWALAVLATADGHIPAAMWAVIAEDDMMIDVGLLSDAAAQVFETAIGTPFDHSKSHIAVGASDGMNPMAGASLAIDPASGIQAYVGDDGLPSTELTATRANGVAGWINVDGDEVQLSITHPSATCTVGAGAIVGDGANATYLPLLPGHFNDVLGGFVCM